VAPFEYTAMFWAVLFGVTIFGDFPDQWTWVGAAVVVGAGLFMLWRDNRQKSSGPISI
jgi:drug/metabolite transporter (DMT)-like permease